MGFDGAAIGCDTYLPFVVLKCRRHNHPIFSPLPPFMRKLDSPL